MGYGERVNYSPLQEGLLKAWRRWVHRSQLVPSQPSLSPSSAQPRQTLKKIHYNVDISNNTWAHHAIVFVANFSEISLIVASRSWNRDSLNHKDFHQSESGECLFVTFICKYLFVTFICKYSSRSGPASFSTFSWEALASPFKGTLGAWRMAI